MSAHECHLRACGGPTHADALPSDAHSMATRRRRPWRQNLSPKSGKSCNALWPPLPLPDESPRAPSDSTAQFELLNAVRSLYKDRLRPLDSHVSRRLDERCAAAAIVDAPMSGCARNAPSRSAKRIAELRSIALVTQGLQVVPLPGGDSQRHWLRLQGAVDDFVDESCQEDSYSEELWQELETHVLKCHAATFGRSRYDCARDLQASMVFLNGFYKLGEICHIVQLAISSRAILGYRDGWIVPFEASVDCQKLFEAQLYLKSSPAISRSSDSSTRSGSSQDPDVFRQHASEELWRRLQVALRQVLASPKWANGLPVSAAKATLLERCDFALRETELGHTKLSNVFKDERLATSFDVIVCGHERYLRLRGDSTAESDQLAAADGQQSQPLGSVSLAELTLSSPTDPCLYASSTGSSTPASESGGTLWERQIKNTFIDISPVRCSSSKRRAGSSPALLQRHQPMCSFQAQRPRTARAVQFYETLAVPAQLPIIRRNIANGNAMPALGCFR